MNSYTSAVNVQKALESLSYGGYDTNLADALRLVRTQVFTTQKGARLSDPSVARLVVVFTENRSANRTATLAEATATRRAGIAIVTVGIGTAVDPYELSAVASYPYYHTMFQVDRLRHLDSLSDPIKLIICRGIYLFFALWFISYLLYDINQGLGT